MAGIEGNCSATSQTPQVKKKKNAYEGTMNLGSRNSKKTAGTVEGNVFTTGGIKINQLSENSQKIAEVLNIEKDGKTDNILDQEELAAFWNELTAIAKDDTLGNREAGKLLKKYGLDEKGITKEDLYKFVEEISQTTQDENIEKSGLDIDQDGNPVVVIDYKADEDGNKVSERVYANQTSSKTTKDSAGNVIASVQLDANGKTLERTEGNTKTIYYYDDDKYQVVTDEEGNEVPQKMVIENPETHKTTLIEYKDGLEAKMTVTGQNSEEIYEYYEENGNRVAKIKSSVTNKGLPTEATTTYSRDEDGTLQYSTTREAGGKLIETYYDSDETTPVYEKITDGTKQTERVYQENRSYTENSTDSSTSESSTTNFNKDGKRLDQTKTVGGKEYNVEYDGAGNTKLVVQFGETPAQIAKAFGCSEQELLEMNGGKKNFKAGAEVLLPKQELEADDKRLQGRGTSEQETAKFEAYQAKQRALKAECDARVDAPEGYFIDPDMSDHSDYSRAENIAAFLYKEEGTTQVTKSQLKARAQQIIADNPGVFDEDGKIKDYCGITNYDGKHKKADGTTLPALNLKVSPEFAEKSGAKITRRQDKDVQLDESTGRRNGAELAKQAKHAMAGAGTRMEKLDEVIGWVNKDSVVGFLNEFNDTGFLNRLQEEDGVYNNRTDKLVEYSAKMTSALEDRAAELGVDISDQLDIVKNSNLYGGKSEILKADQVLQHSVALLKSLEALPPSERTAALANMKTQLSDDNVETLIGIGQERNAEALATLEDQLKKDGFFGDLYDGLKTITFSNNTDQAVKADIDKFTANLEAVQKAYQEHGIDGENGFLATFKDKFGIDCDVRLLKQFDTIQEQLQATAYVEYLEESFGGHENWSEDKLRNEISKFIPEDSKGMDLSAMDKAQLNALINQVVNEAREVRGNSIASSEELQKQRNDIGRQLFGLENDTVFRAMDYAESQQEGAQNLKMLTKVGAAFAIAFAIAFATGGAGGVLVAALDTGVSSLAIDMGDCIYRQKINGGEAMSEEEFKQAACEALVGAAMVGAGGKTAQLLAKIDGLSAMARAGGLLVMNVTLGAGAELVQTGEVTVKGVAYNALFSIAGEFIGFMPKRAGKTPAPEVNKAPEVKPQTTLDKATKSNTTRPGGKLGTGENGKAQRVIKETRDEVSKGIIDERADERAVEMVEEANKLSQTQGNRSTGRQVQHIVEDAVGIYDSPTHGKVDIANETNPAKLADCRNEISRWSDGNDPLRGAATRNKQGLLDAIDERINYLNEHPEVQDTPVESQFVDRYYQNQSSFVDNAILGKKGPLGETDTSTLIDQIKRTTSSDKLREMKAQYETNCKGTLADCDARIRAAFEAQDQSITLAQNQATSVQKHLDSVNAKLQERAAAGKGLSPEELTDLSNAIGRTTDSTQLSTLETNWKAVSKKCSPSDRKKINNLIDTQKAKIASSSGSQAPASDTPASTHVEPAKPADVALDTLFDRISKNGNRKDIRTFLEEKGIEYGEAPGIITYRENNISYQISCDNNGNIKAIRTHDYSTREKSYFRYENGERVKCSREDYMGLRKKCEDEFMQMYLQMEAQAELDGIKTTPESGTEPPSRTPATNGEVPVVDVTPEAKVGEKGSADGSTEHPVIAAKEPAVQTGRTDVANLPTYKGSGADRNVQIHSNAPGFNISHLAPFEVDFNSTFPIVKYHGDRTYIIEKTTSGRAGYGKYYNAVSFKGIIPEDLCLNFAKEANGLLSNGTSTVDYANSMNAIIQKTKTVP